MSDNRQIGWSQEAILLHGISKQLEYISKIVPTRLSPLETNASNRTVWNNGGGDIDSNTVFGAASLESNISGFENSILGYAVMPDTTVGNQNSIIGAYSLYYGVNPNQNTLIGAEVLTSSGTPSNSNFNTGVGVAVFGDGDYTGVGGTAVGVFSSYHIGSGSYNTSMGRSSLGSRTSGNITGSYNIAYSMQAFRNLTSGNNNIGFVTEFNDGVMAGNRNIIIDSRDRPTSPINTNDNVVIGGEMSLATANGQIVIGNGNVNSRRMFFDTTGALFLCSNPLVAPTNGTGVLSEKLLLLDVTVDSNNMGTVEAVDYVDSNTTTIALTLSDLNTAYPGVSIGFRAHCIAIVGGASIYTKVSTTAWCRQIINITA